MLTGSNQSLDINDGSMTDSMKNQKSFEVPFEVQILNCSTTATYIGNFRNAAEVWHKVRQYVHTGRKYKC